MKIRRFLFLDVDEVLNSIRTRYAYSFSEEALKGDLTERLDPVAIEFLNGMYKQGVEIVISSIWRIQKMELLQELLPFPIPLKTGRSKEEFINSRRVQRGLEIQEFLDSIEEDYLYCIVDDGQDFLEEQLKFHVHIDYRNGMLVQDFEKIAGLLGVYPYDIR